MPKYIEIFEPLNADQLNSLIPRLKGEQLLLAAGKTQKRPSPPAYRLAISPPDQKAIDRAVESACKGIRFASERTGVRNSLLRCFDIYVQEIERLNEGLHPAEFSKYWKALQRVEAAKAGLSVAGPGDRRSAQRRLKTARKSAVQANELLTARATSAIDHVRQVLYCEPDLDDAEFNSVGYLVSHLETENSREHQEAPRHRLQRGLALIAWGINPGKWRTIVSECMEHAGIQCINPTKHMVRFDQQIGVEWIAKFLPKLADHTKRPKS